MPHLGIVVRPMTDPAWRIPENTDIQGVSPHILFHRNLLAYKIEHPDLPDTPLLGTIPFVEPKWSGDVFDGWKILSELPGELPAR